MLPIVKGMSWKAAMAQLSNRRIRCNALTKTRFFALVATLGLIALGWRGICNSATDVQSFYCWGPSTPPKDMSQNEYARWTAHMRTPVLFNDHAPIKIDAETVQYVNLNSVKSTRKALHNEERILILTPLKDAVPYLSKHFELLAELTYPHHLIDLAFLVSDSKDDTLAVLSSELNRIQKRPDQVPFRSATVMEKDFHFILNQDVNERHSFEAQGPRRKALGRARNYLLATALKPEHSWVYWRDVDIVDSPKKIIEDMIAHDKDIIVPNVWFHRYENSKDIEGRFDYNSWIESKKALKLTSQLDKKIVLAEGYRQYDTGRTYLATMGDWRENKDVEVELDGIGGVNIVVKADVHRSGINFPCYAFENQAETEGFAKMAKRAGYQVIGLPNYIVWHIDTQEIRKNI